MSLSLRRELSSSLAACRPPEELFGLHTSSALVLSDEQRIDERAEYSRDHDGHFGVSSWSRIETRHRVMAIVETRSGVLVATSRGPNPPVELESMPLYVRVGIRILFGDRSTLNGAILNSREAQKLFRHQSILQGKKFDQTRHAQRRIRHFIQAYHIDCSELLKPDLRSYATLNEFFCRKLNPLARPIASPRDTSVISSAADCRLVVYPSITAAQKFWIKGHHFSLATLLGDERMATYFQGGSIACFRLAPADYHRFHSPVDAVVVETKKVEGSYLTVNPVVVQNPSLDVFGQNRRMVTYLKTLTGPRREERGPLVAFVQVGALLVGSIRQTVRVGQIVHRGDEMGYFCYGGSTVLAIFPRDTVKFDSDLRRNSEKPLETLVKVGERIGRWLE